MAKYNIVLSLTLEQAKWLKTVMQNPINNHLNIKESEEDENNRKFFWNELNEINPS